MTPNELKLAATLLLMASEEYGNHGCNDLDRELLDGFSEQEKRQLVYDFYVFNGEPEVVPEVHDINPAEAYRLPDYCFMGLMAHKLNESGSVKK